MGDIETRMDGVLIYNTPLDNMIGAKTILETIIEEPTMQSPQLCCAQTIVNEHPDVGGIHRQIE